MMSTFTRIIRLNPLKNSIYNVVRHSSMQSTFNSSVPKYMNNINPWIWQQNSNFQLPQIRQQNVDLPSGLIWSPFIKEDTNEIIEEPNNHNIDNTKHAAKLIVIRRKKMKKHQLRKLRKKMKFEWAKLRQRRELKKEKAFQATLIQKCKDAEAFSAENFVEQKLAKLNEFIMPNRWKGRRMPEFLIREKMGLPPKSKS